MHAGTSYENDHFAAARVGAPCWVINSLHTKECSARTARCAVLAQTASAEQVRARRHEQGGRHNTARIANATRSESSLDGRERVLLSNDRRRWQTVVLAEQLHRFQDVRFTRLHARWLPFRSGRSTARARCIRVGGHIVSQRKRQCKRPLRARSRYSAKEEHRTDSRKPRNRRAAGGGRVRLSNQAVTLW